MTRQEFLKVMVEERGLDLVKNAIYLDDCIDHPFALGVYQEGDAWITYYQNNSCMEENVTCDTEEEAFDALMEFIETRELESGIEMS